jgi:hypothetical protein
MTTFDDAMDSIPEETDDRIGVSREGVHEQIRMTALNFAQHVPHNDIDTYIEDSGKIYDFIVKGLDQG